MFNFGSPLNSTISPLYISFRTATQSPSLHNMNYYAMRYLGFFLILLLSPYCATCDKNSFLTPYHEVHITNELPSNAHKLTLHCQSKDDDLGYHDLRVGQDFQWGFHRNMRGTTLFFCHFWWNNKQRAFAVYNSIISEGRHSFWIVKADGFYFKIRESDEPFLRNEW